MRLMGMSHFSNRRCGGALVKQLLMMLLSVHRVKYSDASPLRQRDVGSLESSQNILSAFQERRQLRHLARDNNSLYNGYLANLLCAIPRL